ncbi:hypothetical protein [Halovivax gelatinilyticus]|uniref:hypothetical protein n=1 Tax=Halovivax gelatinilyticus TaxID=2961597 RepID=UPI0020CA2CB6|nr:hypothetical protein [Halovivax gelatinilyticus]
MNLRRLGGALGVLTVFGFVAIGLFALLTENVFGEPAGNFSTPTVASLAFAAVVIGVLVAIGSRSGRTLETPYW